MTNSDVSLLADIGDRDLDLALRAVALGRQRNRLADATRLERIGKATSSDL
jgi:hypothetical protein